MASLPDSDDCLGVGCATLIGVVVLFASIGALAEGNPLGILGLVALGGATAIGIAVHRHDKDERLRQQAVLAQQSAEIGRYHLMSPRQFEEAIAYLCQRDGCQNAQVVGGANDLGADVIATAPDGRRIVIQCKRYGPTTKVGSPDLQRFGGTCYSVHGAQVAAVVTTSVFTRPASEYANRHGIWIFNEAALAAWATRTGPAPWML